MNVLEEAEKFGVMKKASTHKGGEFHGSCPGCGGKDRFHVWPDQNEGVGSYWCRQCGKGGDLIQFLMDFCGKTFPQAAQMAGKEISAGERYSAPKPPKSSRADVVWVPSDSSVLDRRVERWMERAVKLVGWGNRQLSKDVGKMSWLEKRGISMETAMEFQLGFNPGKDGKDLFRTRESWGLNTIVKKNGQKKRLWIPRGVLIPYFRNGELYRVRIRRFEEKGPKYYFLPGGSAEIMVLGVDAKAHVIVEAELDAILVYQEVRDLGVGAVAVGSSHAKPDRAAHAVLEKSLAILNALDFDDAGKKASDWWTRQYARCERWPVPDGKDPGEAYERGVDIREWVVAGLPPALTVGKSRLARRREEVAEQSAAGSSDSASERGASRPQKGSNLPFKAKPVPRQEERLSESVRELLGYLRAYPVKIRNTPNTMQVIRSDSWASKNWGLSNQISTLVFRDEACRRHIMNHPEAIITGKNFLETGDAR